MCVDLFSRVAAATFVSVQGTAGTRTVARTEHTDAMPILQASTPQGSKHSKHTK